MDSDFDPTGFDSKNAGVEVDVVGLARRGGESLRKNTAGWTKYGPVSWAGRAFGSSIENESGAGYRPGGDGIISVVRTGLEVAVGDEVLAVGGEARGNRQTTA